MSQSIIEIAIASELKEKWQYLFEIGRPGEIRTKTWGSLMRLPFDYGLGSSTALTASLTLVGKADAIALSDDPDQIIPILSFIDHFTVDSFDIIPLLEKTARYQHTHNGSTAATVEPFGRHLGCDGVVTFDLTLPLSHWVVKEYPF